MNICLHKFICFLCLGRKRIRGRVSLNEHRQERQVANHLMAEAFVVLILLSMIFCFLLGFMVKLLVNLVAPYLAAIAIVVVIKRAVETAANNARGQQTSAQDHD